MKLTYIDVENGIDERLGLNFLEKNTFVNIIFVNLMFSHCSSVVRLNPVFVVCMTLLFIV